MACASSGSPTIPDLWLKPSGATLEVVDVRVHKAPKRYGDAWKLVTRNPIVWWWIPATEHPGETEEKRGWQVESAVHEHIARAVKDGVLLFKDGKTGRELALEFVEIHKPLRRMEGEGLLRLLRLPRAGHERQVLRPRILARRGGRQAGRDGGPRPRGAEGGGRTLGAGPATASRPTR
jgi:hypothetical protein